MEVPPEGVGRAAIVSAFELWSLISDLPIPNSLTASASSSRRRRRLQNWREDEREALPWTPGREKRLDL